MNTNKKSTLFAVSVLAMSISNAMAQQAGAEAEPSVGLEEVVVTGYAASLKKAVEQKRAANSVVDMIESEDLGKFPDANVAESLQRVTGVAIDRSAGEGQKITVRGLGPEFNIVTMNGRVLPNPDGARSFSFDVLASEMISGAEVYKSSQADQPDGGIGASVNIKTMRPLDGEAGLVGAASVKGMYEELTETTSPQASGLVSFVNDEGSFGIAASLAYQKRDARIDSVGSDAGWQYKEFDLDGNGAAELQAWAPRNMGFRVDQNKRERTSGMLVAQWAPDDKLTVTADVLYSKFEVESTRNQVAHWWGGSTNNAGPGSVKIDEQGTVVYLAGHAAPTEFVHSTGNRPTTTYMAGINIEKIFENDAVLTLDISNAKAQNDAGGNQSFAVTGFRNTTESSSVFQLIPGEVLPSLLFPTFDAESGTYSAQYDPVIGDYVGELTANPAELTDTSLLSNHFMVVEGNDNEDVINDFKVDVELPLDLAVISTVKAGAFYNSRDFQRTRLRSDSAVNNGTSTGFGDPVPAHIGNRIEPSNFLGGTAGNFPTAWIATDNEALRAYYESDDFVKNGTLYSEQRLANPDLPVLDYTPAVELQNSPGVEEQNTGFFVQLDLEGELGAMPWSGNVGIRSVSTETTSTGFGREVLAIEPHPDDPTVTNVILAEAQPLMVENEYSHVLPSLNLKFDVLDAVDFRVGASQTITRPEINRIGVDVGVNARPGENIITGGNPSLKPYKSTNLDLALNYYLGDSGYLGVAYMSKKIEDFIAQDSIQTTIVGVQATESRPINIETSEIDGLEFAAQYLFENLPGALSGIGVQANYTIVDSDSGYRTTENGNRFGIVGLSDTANFIFSYEYDRVSARLSYNWRDGFLNNVSDSQLEPRYTSEYGQWDMFASYDLTDSVSVFVEGNNITGEANRTYSRYENRLTRYSYAGKRFAAGIRARF